MCAHARAIMSVCVSVCTCVDVHARTRKLECVPVHVYCMSVASCKPRLAPRGSSPQRQHPHHHAALLTCEPWLMPKPMLWRWRGSTGRACGSGPGSSSPANSPSPSWVNAAPAPAPSPPPVGAATSDSWSSMDAAALAAVWAPSDLSRTTGGGTRTAASPAPGYAREPCAHSARYTREWLRWQRARWVLVGQLSTPELQPQPLAEYQPRPHSRQLPPEPQSQPQPSHPTVACHPSACSDE